MHLSRVLDIEDKEDKEDKALMAVSVVTLNIEGDKHFSRFIPVLQQLQPEVFCVQEVFEVDLPRIRTALGIPEENCLFLPMTNMASENKYNISPRGPWGVALLTTLQHSGAQKKYYKGSGTTPLFTTPNSVDRGLLCTKVSKGTDSLLICTTHFTWTGDGQSSPEQQRDFVALKETVAEFPSHVLCGDFNSPRGGEIFSLFTTIYQDGLPARVTTTIDGSLHYAGNLELAVDTAFYQQPLQVEVHQILEGVSDHKGISFLVRVA